MSSALRLVKNLFFIFVTKGIDLVSHIVLLPFLVNKLGIATYGELSFALAIGLFINAMMQYGFSISAVRTIAKQRDDRAMLSQSASTFLVASWCIAGTLFVLSLPILVFDFSDTMQTLILASLVFAVIQSLFPVWLFLGLEKMHYLVATSGVGRLLSLIAILVWVDSSEDAVWVLVLQALGWLIAIVISIVIFFKDKPFDFVFPKSSQIFAVIKEGWSSFLIQITPNLGTHGTVFIIGLFFSSSVVGVYAAAARVLDILNALANLVVNAAIPIISRNLSVHNWFKKIMVLVGVALASVVAFAAPYITDLIFKENAHAIADMVMWLALTIPFVFIRLAFGPAYLMLVGKDTSYQNIVMYMSLVGFVASWSLAPFDDIYYLIAVSVVNSVIMAVLTFNSAYLYNKKKSRKSS